MQKCETVVPTPRFVSPASRPEPPVSLVAVPTPPAGPPTGVPARAPFFFDQVTWPLPCCHHFIIFSI